ncbi:thioredoxin [Candidatus Phytoplasma oryzae]|uniref:Thioredoxin n=1 Tax=Candidatus Phytoplasma oryzae TaxID=203274 RepID=A0A139JQ71_9MOLU|nr:thioredoxin [Candidatus Phytoplasma oryzae]KXT29112.1 thioredoxin [Candidatus Phytoplasma oryzae]RAM57816.1 thioredoxin [Candidatus Phytoplasma oryzae]
MIISKIDLQNIINKEENVLVDFFANWCAPCQRLMPILEKLKKERKDIKIVKIDIDLNQDLLLDNNIKSFPTLILYKKGKEIKRKIGFCSFEELLIFIQ